MSITEVSFSGSVSEQQFNRVQSALLPRWSRWYVFAPACVLTFIGLGAGWGTAIAEPLRALPDVAWGLAVLAACWLITRYGRRRAWQNYIRLHGTVSGRVGPAGVEWKTDVTNASMPWEKLLGFRTIGELVLVFYAPRCAYFLPRDFFAGEHEWSGLHEVLSRYSKPI